MNTWTISRRIIVGFAVIVLITLALGLFALWRLTGLAEDIAYVADNSVPSILMLREAGNVSRDNLISLLQIDPSGCGRSKRGARTENCDQHGAQWTS